MNILETTRLCDQINRLMDLEQAGERRCRVTAAHVDAAPLQGRLLLCAAGHADDAEHLRELVLEFDGITHAGDTTAVLADPVHLSPQVDGGGDRELLAACIEEQDVEIARFEHVLQETHWPEPARDVVWTCLGNARLRRQGLAQTQTR